LDYTNVASIGSIMAKTRTSPLDITTFFAKKGEPAHPLGILLYAKEVPFELVVNTKIKVKDLSSSFRKFFNKFLYFKSKQTETCYVPLFVSMVPGDTIHFIKKISSLCNAADAIWNAFYLEGLAEHKTFIIDEIAAPFSQEMRQR